VPIVPVVYRASSKIAFQSWDGFQVPLPFARCRVNFAEAVRVPRDASESEREALRQKLQQSMMSITQD